MNNDIQTPIEPTPIEPEINKSAQSSQPEQPQSLDIPQQPEESQAFPQPEIQKANTTGINVKCPRCNTFSQTHFCPNCGFDLVANFAYAMKNQQPSQYHQTSQHQPQNQMPNQFQHLSQNPYYSMRNNTNIPVQKKKNTAVILVVALLIFVALVICGISLFNMIIKDFDRFQGNSNGFTQNIPNINDDSKNSKSEIPNGISLSEFQKLKVGMSYAHVSGIIGGDGVITDEGENLRNERYVTYSWVGENNENAAVHITFIDGAVSEIIEEGDL